MATIPASIEPPERRDNTALFTLVTTILTEQRDIDKKLMAHINDEAVNFERVVSQAMAMAYPAGDAEGHRRNHELAIKLAERKVEFWEKMKIAVSSWGLIGVLGAMVLWVWAGFVRGPHA